MKSRGPTRRHGRSTVWSAGTCTILTAITEPGDVGIASIASSVAPNDDRLERGASVVTAKPNRRLGGGAVPAHADRARAGPPFPFLVLCRRTSSTSPPASPGCRRARQSTARPTIRRLSCRRAAGVGQRLGTVASRSGSRRVPAGLVSSHERCRGSRPFEDGGTRGPEPGRAHHGTYTLTVPLFGRWGRAHGGR